MYSGHRRISSDKDDAFQCVHFPHSHTSVALTMNVWCHATSHRHTGNRRFSALTPLGSLLGGFRPELWVMFSLRHSPYCYNRNRP